MKHEETYIISDIKQDLIEFCKGIKEIIDSNLKLSIYNEIKKQC